ncbi:MAG: uL22 family ribosomal protein [Candidatus Aenigmatarchaeota archaeon]|nr:hypothetical protein [Candidatus Aenigmarchaeota archaeon]
MKYAINKDVLAKACKTARISNKAAIKICRKINRLKFQKAVSIINDLVSKKISLEGKYFTSAAKSIQNLLKELEANAKQKNIDLNSTILFISSHKGPTLMRSRRKRKFGIYIKSTNLQAVLKKHEGMKKEKVQENEGKKDSTR